MRKRYTPRRTFATLLLAMSVLASAAQTDHQARVLPTRSAHAPAVVQAPSVLSTKRVRRAPRATSPRPLLSSPRTWMPLPGLSVNKAPADQHHDLEAERGGAPLNNNCSGAISLTMGASCVGTVGTVDQATQSIAAIDCATFTGNANDDVWYSFVATASEATIFLDGGASFDGVIDLRSGACNGTNIACMDNFIAGGDETLLATGLTVGTTYRIRVYDYEAGYPLDPTFTICVYGTPEAPPNDLCEDATITNLSVPGTAMVNGDNTGATDTELFGVATAWEAFTISACADVTVSYCGTTPAFGNSFVELVIGCPFGSTIANESFDVTSCGDDNVTVFFQDVPAGTYYYPVLTEPGSEGPYTITFAAAPCGGGGIPANDVCADAVIQAVTVPGSGSFSGDNTGGTNDEGLAFGAVWEAFTINACADVTIDYCGTDPVFGNFYSSVVTDCAFSGVIDATSNTDCGDGNLLFVYEDLPAGTYYIPVLVEPGVAEGPYAITVTTAPCGGGGTPANDVCADAVIQGVAVPGSESFSGDNTGATNDEALDFGAVWEAFTIDACADVTIDYCGTNPVFGNFYISVVTDCAFSGVVDATTTDCGDGNLSLFYEDLPAGTYYVPVLMEPGVAEGPYTFTITTVPCGGGGTSFDDECADAEPLLLADGGSLTYTGDNTGCTDTEGLGFDNAWVSFLLTECMDVTWDFCGSPASMLVYTNIWSGCPSEGFSRSCNDVPDITCTDGGTGPQPTAYGLPPGTYYIVIPFDSIWGGQYQVNVTGVACSTPTPVNDECAAAIQLTPTDACVPVNGTTAGATRSLPDLECNGFTGSADDDVWYRFTATTPGGEIRATPLEELDLVVQLYTGVCGGLSPLNCADDGLLGGEEVLVYSGLTVGNTYFYRVHGYYVGQECEGFFTTCVLQDISTLVTEARPGEATIAPNPTDGLLNIVLPGGQGNVLIEVIDVAGRTVFAEQRAFRAGGALTCDLSGGVTAGIYTVRLSTGDRRLEQRILVR